MTPSIEIAKAALAEIGREDLQKFLEEIPHCGIMIRSPCENPDIIIRAVALAHQAAGHTTIITELEEHRASFECIDCQLNIA